MNYPRCKVYQQCFTTSIKILMMVIVLDKKFHTRNLELEIKNSRKSSKEIPLHCLCDQHIIYLLGDVILLFRAEFESITDVGTQFINADIILMND